MMPTAMGLAFAGFAALSLAMDRHGEQVLGRRGLPAWQRRGLRVAGSALLGGSLTAVVGQHGWGMGLIVWTGLLTAAAMALAMLLCYRPRAVPMALAGIGIGLVVTWVGG